MPASKRVYFRLPEYRLTVELDSFTYHNSLHSWKQDHRCEREAHARGDDLRRYTGDDQRRYTYEDVFARHGTDAARAAAPVGARKAYRTG